MEKQTVFIKRYPIKGESPKHNKVYTTDLGEKIFSVSNNSFMSSFGMGQISPKWWLEEVELPSEEDVFSKSITKYSKYEPSERSPRTNAFQKGANFILNKLKGK